MARPANRKPSPGKPRKPFKDKAADQPKAEPETIRLNKFLSNAGVCSRRKADEFIQAGRIRVNEELAKEVGVRVGLRDKVYLDGKRIYPGRKVYLLVNKPKDIICTTNDERGRRTIIDLVSQATEERVYPVGRLDRNTTGVILVTNDGELAQKLMHPSKRVPKIYKVELNKPLTEPHREAILAGISLEEGKAVVDAVEFPEESRRVVGVELHIGWNRVVRRIFESLGYQVVKLDRVVFAGLTKKDLPRGKYRHLTAKEIRLLKHFT